MGGEHAARSPDDWDRWLGQLTDEQAGMPAELVRGLWRGLRDRVGPQLQVPAAGPGGVLGFYMAWHREGTYLDVDVAPDGCFKWFWTDRRTGEAEGSEFERLTSPPEAMVRRLAEDFTG